MKRLFTITLIAAIILGILTTPALAQSRDKASRLDRGIKNVAWGWTEIPNSIVTVTRETNNPFLGITVGVIKGVLNAFARTTSGTTDIIVAPAKREAHKESEIKPEMVEVSSSK